MPLPQVSRNKSGKGDKNKPCEGKGETAKGSKDIERQNHKIEETKHRKAAAALQAAQRFQHANGGAPSKRFPPLFPFAGPSSAGSL